MNIGKRIFLIGLSLLCFGVVQSQQSKKVSNCLLLEQIMNDSLIKTWYPNEQSNYSLGYINGETLEGIKSLNFSDCKNVTLGGREFDIVNADSKDVKIRLIPFMITYEGDNCYSVSIDNLEKELGLNFCVRIKNGKYITFLERIDALD